MAYWWVSQNQTFREERRGGYLWAPKSGSNGVVFTHWSNMTLVQPGDVIFSYAKLRKRMSAARQLFINFLCYLFASKIWT